jgi:hypothetical protein
VCDLVKFSQYQSIFQCQLLVVGISMRHHGGMASFPTSKKADIAFGRCKIAILSVLHAVYTALTLCVRLEVF